LLVPVQHNTDANYDQDFQSMRNKKEEAGNQNSALSEVSIFDAEQIEPLNQ